jgi:hypothetical protein
MADILCIKAFGNRSDAEIAKSALAARHIDSYLDADDAGGMYPFPMSGHQKGVRLFIKNNDKQKAKQILKL